MVTNYNRAPLFVLLAHPIQLINIITIIIIILLASSTHYRLSFSATTIIRRDLYTFNTNNNNDSYCLQLNLTLLDPWASALRSDISSSRNSTYRCTSIRQALHFLMVDYVARTGHFWLPDANAAQSCWESLLASVVSQNVSMAVDSVKKECNFSSEGLTREGLDDRCRSLTDVNAITKELQMQTPPGNTLIARNCVNASSTKLSACSACTQAMVQAMTTDKFFMQPASSAHASHPSAGRPLITCQDILPIFAASTQPDTASRIQAATCLLNFNLTNTNSTLIAAAYINSRHVTFLFGSLGATITLFIFALVFLVALYFHRRHIKHLATNIYNKHRSMEKETRAKSNTHLTWYTLEDIKAATQNFSTRNLLGAGGFGSVYKGILHDGTEVAVKKFKNCLAGITGDDEFFQEVEMITSVRHKNLVGVRGCCVNRTLSEETKTAAATAWMSKLNRHSRRHRQQSSDEVQVQRMIVYEYMPNGSLQEHLSREAGRAAMDWKRRKNIAVGIVRGIAYLHTEVRPSIVHRDIKSSNILLDAAWNARVADFGLAKFTPEGATHVTTRVAGTFGYVAPEYVLYGKLNEKSDVYSLGVLLLELLAGRKIIGNFQEETEVQRDHSPSLITDWAWDLIRQGHIERVVDPLMRVTVNDTDEDSEVSLNSEWKVVDKFVCIGVLCAHPHVTCRPSIEDVVRLMETEAPLPDPLPDRPPPFTAFNICAHVDGSRTSGNSTSSPDLVNFNASSSTSSAGFCSYTYDQLDLAR